MSPAELAQKNETIQEAQMQAIQKTVQSIMEPVKIQVQEMLQHLELDKKGKVAKTSVNRALIRKALALYKKAMKKIPGESFKVFYEGQQLMQINTEGYIEWQRNQK